MWLSTNDFTILLGEYKKVVFWKSNGVQSFIDVLKKSQIQSILLNIDKMSLIVKSFKIDFNFD